MLELAWDIFVIAVLAVVAVLFVVSAATGPNLVSRLAGVVGLFAGAAAGADILRPWLPVALAATAAALKIAGRWQAKQLPPGAAPVRSAA